MEKVVMYRYAQVENALMDVFKFPETYRIPLRARLKNLQRLGVRREAPGKGGNIAYTFDDVCLWAMCLELAQFGMDPTRIALMAQWLWVSAEPALTAAPDGDDIFFAAYPNALTRDAIEREAKSGTTGQGLVPVGMDGPRMGLTFRFSELTPDHLSRAVVINLSRLRRRVVEALAEAGKSQRTKR